VPLIRVSETILQLQYNPWENRLKQAAFPLHSETDYCVRIDWTKHNIIGESSLKGKLLHNKEQITKAQGKLL
jgi:hypothetical protein